MSAATAHVYEQGATVNGRTLGEWAQAWGQWAYAFPATSSPLRDAPGTNRSANQPKGVFFLTGSDSPGTYVRDVTIPTGTKLFFPVLDTIWITLPSDEPITIDQIRDILADLQSGSHGLFASVDGRPVEDVASHREVDSAPGGFDVTLPANNVFGVPGGTYGKSAIDGVFLMLQPLTPGEHTVHFGGAAGDFSLDVTYHVTVQPPGQAKKEAAVPPPAATVFSTKPVKAADGKGVWD
jgi:hypothetical protein